MGLWFEVYGLIETHWMNCCWLLVVGKISHIFASIMFHMKHF